MSKVIGHLGRLLFASLFIISGVSKLATFDLQTGGPITEFAAPKLQAHYPLLILAAAVLELVGGVLFVLNASFGAIMLILFLVPTTLVIHDFWNLEPGTSQQQAEMAQFMKNVCLLGALLFFLTGKSSRAAASKQKAS